MVIWAAAQWPVDLTLAFLDTRECSTGEDCQTADQTVAEEAESPKGSLSLDAGCLVLGHKLVQEDEQLLIHLLPVVSAQGLWLLNKASVSEGG